jgi:Choline/Carnitine o-acyltransferase
MSGGVSLPLVHAAPLQSTLRASESFTQYYCKFIMREFIESDGDYRGEKHLELGAGSKPLPLYAHQDSLPTLPVAPLKETCAKYLASVRPLVGDAQYKATEAAVAEFTKPGGVGERLHARLMERASARKDTSWIAKWWNQMGYLQVQPVHSCLMQRHYVPVPQHQI